MPIEHYLLADTLAHFLVPVVQVAWIFPLLVGLETLWPMGTVPADSRLRGLVILLAYLGISAPIMAAADVSIAALGLRPLFAVSWKGPLASAIGASAFAFILDFFNYWTHRAQHRVPFLWRFHAVHHSIRDLSAMNAYQHWTEQVWRFPLVTIGITLCFPAGMRNEGLVAALCLISGYYVHAQTRLHFGPLRRVFVDNRVHRIHHSTESCHYDKNFGVFTTIWDQLFGTAAFPEPGEWPATGVSDQLEGNYPVDVPRSTV